MPLERNERRWRWSVIAVITVLTSLPYLVGWLKTDRQRAYIGRQPTSVADTAAYYSNIEQARQGRLLLANQFTSEPQRPTLFHPLWLLLGWVARLTTLSTPWVFHLARAALVVLFLVLLDRALRWLFPDWPRRCLALVIVATSSGLGWVVLLTSTNPLPVLQMPVDTWVAEANTFLSLGHSALFIASQLLLAYLYWSVYRLTVDRVLNRWVGLAVLTLGLLHPYDLVAAFFVTTLWLFGWFVVTRPSQQTQATQFWQLVRWWLWAVPLIPYYVLIVLREPAMAGWLSQNVDVMPSFPAVLVGYGLLWPLACLGGRALWQTRRSAVIFLAGWIALTVLLAYLPGVSFQRRLLNGLHLPLAILAAAGLIGLVDRVASRSWRTLTTVSAVLLLAMTNFFVMQSAIVDELHPNQAASPQYESRNVVAAIAWLRDHSRMDDVVFSQVWNGNTIAGLAGRTVVLGHGHQTLKPADRWRDWDEFRSTRLTEGERTAMLRRLRVSWLFWTTGDEAVSAYRPELDQRWSLAFRNPGVRLYRLQPH